MIQGTQKDSPGSNSQIDQLSMTLAVDDTGIAKRNRANSLMRTKSHESSRTPGSYPKKSNGLTNIEIFSNFLDRNTSMNMDISDYGIV